MSDRNNVYRTEGPPFPPRVVEAALGYSPHGFLVLPLHTPVEGSCSCGAEGCSSPGKHPRTRRGHHEASIDPAQIRGWWEKWPEANIGIRTGAESGLVVLDVDPDHGGDESLAELETQYMSLSPTRFSSALVAVAITISSSTLVLRSGTGPGSDPA